jgi:hypothetical protein
MRANMSLMAASALLVSFACGCAAETEQADTWDSGSAAEPQQNGAVGTVGERLVGNPPGYNPPGTNPYNPAVNPPGYNPPGTGVCATPGYNPPGYNPPGYNAPGYNPPGYNPPAWLLRRALGDRGADFPIGTSASSSPRSGAPKGRARWSTGVPGSTR